MAPTVASIMGQAYPFSAALQVVEEVLSIGAADAVEAYLGRCCVAAKAAAPSSYEILSGERSRKTRAKQLLQDSVATVLCRRVGFPADREDEGDHAYVRRFHEATEMGMAFSTAVQGSTRSGALLQPPVSYMDEVVHLAARRWAFRQLGEPTLAGIPA